MVSSAIYRYFASRDELLTALIIDGYNAIGQAVEDADAKCRRDDYPGRWRAACRAARAWALAHPHEYALIYGSPVPGYQAPPDTIGPAARSAAVFGRLISDAHAAGERGPGARAPGTRPANARPARATRRCRTRCPRTPAAPGQRPAGGQRRDRGRGADGLGRSIRGHQLRAVRPVQQRRHRYRRVFRPCRRRPGPADRPRRLRHPPRDEPPRQTDARASRGPRKQRPAQAEARASRGPRKQRPAQAEARASRGPRKQRPAQAEARASRGPRKQRWSIPGFMHTWFCVTQLRQVALL